MSLDKPQLRSHKPSKAVAAPMVLVEGEEKAGKTWAMIALTRDERVGRAFFLDLGEGTAEEYGAIPGAAYEVLEHDGTYASILEQVLAVKELAKKAAAAGELPVCLLLDSWTDEWDGLKAWVNGRAKVKPKNQAKLREDPAAELDVPRNLWNDVDSRHARFMNALMTFPGIVVGTARGKEISATDPNTGQPYRDGRRDYRVEGHKNLAYQATLWVRMTRGRRPAVVGARSVHAGINPAEERPREIEGHDEDLLAWLVFDVLRYQPIPESVREVKHWSAGELTDEERADDQAEEAKSGRQEPQDRRQSPPVARPAQSAASPQSAPEVPLTADEKVAKVQAWRKERNEARRGPQMLQVQARADDALRYCFPDWTPKDRQDERTGALQEMGTSPVDATVAQWVALAEKWEAEHDRIIRERHEREQRRAGDAARASVEEAPVDSGAQEAPGGGGQEAPPGGGGAVPPAGDQGAN